MSIKLREYYVSLIDLNDSLNNSAPKQITIAHI